MSQLSVYYGIVCLPSLVPDMVAFRNNKLTTRFLPPAPYTEGKKRKAASKERDFPKYMMIGRPSSIYFTAALASMAALAHHVDSALAAEAARGAALSTSSVARGGAEDGDRRVVPPPRDMMKVKSDSSENITMRTRMHATKKDPSAKAAKDETRSPTGSKANKTTGSKATKTTDTSTKAAKTSPPTASTAPSTAPTEDPTHYPTFYPTHDPTTSESPSTNPVPT